MRRLRAWVVRLASLVGRTRRDRELAEELESHLQLHVDDNLRAGLSAAEARRDALLKLGGVEQTKELAHDARATVVDAIWHDVWFSLRRLRRESGFVAAVLATLALGIGTNTTVFAVAYGYLVNPLPFRDGDRLTTIILTAPSIGRDRWPMSYAEFQNRVRSPVRLAASRHVRQQIEVRARPDPGQARQVPEARHEARVVARHQHPPTLFVPALEVADDIEPPGLLIGLGKAQLRDRNPQLSRPSLLVRLDRRVPDAVPRIIPALDLLDRLIRRRRARS